MKILPLEGKVILGDAMFCQRDLSRLIVRRRGTYLFPVKANQPELLAILKLAFEDRDFPPWERSVATAERETACTTEKAHGRIEQRALTLNSALRSYLDWPGVEQAFQLTRRRTVHGKSEVKVSYGITSLRLFASGGAVVA